MRGLQNDTILAQQQSQAAIHVRHDQISILLIVALSTCAIQIDLQYRDVHVILRQRATGTCLLREMWQLSGYLRFSVILAHRILIATTCQSVQISDSQP